MENPSSEPTTVQPLVKQCGIGLIVGKFMPPHTGHLSLINFARQYVEKLMILVYTRRTDPIPGDLRYMWMKELCPDDIVVHQADKNPLEATDHPDFWNIWGQRILQICPLEPEVIFTSEEYGPKLAASLGTKLISDVPKRIISATQIRKDPYGYWEYIPLCVRSYFPGQHL